MNTKTRNVARQISSSTTKNQKADNTNMLAVGGYQHSVTPIIDADTQQVERNTIRPRACEEVIVA